MIAIGKALVILLVMIVAVEPEAQTVGDFPIKPFSYKPFYFFLKT